MENYRPVNCKTTGEVIKALKRLPKDTPVRQGFEESVDIVFFNQGRSSEHISFEDGGDWTANE